MMPDELLQMDNEKCIVFVRGQKPIQLTKITPEELPGSGGLKPCRVVDHIPAWRETEAEYERKRQEAIAAEAKAEAARKAAALVPPAGTVRKGASKPTINPPGQQSFWQSSEEETALPGPAGKSKSGEIIEEQYIPVDPDQLTAAAFLGGLLNRQRKNETDMENGAMALSAAHWTLSVGWRKSLPRWMRSLRRQQRRGGIPDRPRCRNRRAPRSGTRNRRLPRHRARLGASARPRRETPRLRMRMGTHR